MDVFPQKLSDWNYDTIEELVRVNYEEDQKIEYKEFLDDPNPPKEQKKNYRLDLQKECCGFANADGGFIIFGVAEEEDKKIIKGFKLVEEVNLKIAQILSNTTPTVNFETKKIEIKNGLVLLVIEILASTDKPVQCSDGSFYLRINGGKQPLSRNFLMDWFVAKEIKRQLLGKLKFEITYMKETIDKLENENLYSSALLPPFYQFRLKELQEALSGYYYIHTDPNIEKIIKKIQKQSAEINFQEKYFNMDYSIKMSIPWGKEWADRNGFLRALSTTCQNTNNQLAAILREFKVQLNELNKLL